ncbi:lateral signaling target protein 2 homolog [Glandiceps talaboti]
MLSLRKWLYKPKKTDTQLLAQFYYADEELNEVAIELDSFDGRKDPERCTALVNQLRSCQDKVLSIITNIVEVAIPNDKANRDFQVKFPDDVLQDTLAGQLWFGAECLAAGSTIMNREMESAALRPRAKEVIRSLDCLRSVLRDQCLRNVHVYTDKIKDTLMRFDQIFADFEYSYVSAMVPVKTARDYETQQEVVVLFCETVARALQLKLLTQDQLDSCDPALMFTIPRLAIICGLYIYPEGPLNCDQEPCEMSEMFRPFHSLLYKIRELIHTLSERELFLLEKALSSAEEPWDYLEKELSKPTQEGASLSKKGMPINQSKNKRRSHDDSISSPSSSSISNQSNSSNCTIKMDQSPPCVVQSEQSGSSCIQTDQSDSSPVKNDQSDVLTDSSTEREYNSTNRSNNQIDYYETSLPETDNQSENELIEPNVLNRKLNVLPRPGLPSDISVSVDFRQEFATITIRPESLSRIEQTTQSVSSSGNTDESDVGIISDVINISRTEWGNCNFTGHMTSDDIASDDVFVTEIETETEHAHSSRTAENATGSYDAPCSSSLCETEHAHNSKTAENPDGIYGATCSNTLSETEHAHRARTYENTAGSYGATCSNSYVETGHAHNSRTAENPDGIYGATCSNSLSETEHAHSARTYENTAGSYGATCSNSYVETGHAHNSRTAENTTGSYSVSCNNSYEVQHMCNFILGDIIQRAVDCASLRIPPDNNNATAEEVMVHLQEQSRCTEGKGQGSSELHDDDSSVSDGMCCEMSHDCHSVEGSGCCDCHQYLPEGMIKKSNTVLFKPSDSDPNSVHNCTPLEHTAFIPLNGHSSNPNSPDYCEYDDDDESEDRTAEGMSGLANVYVVGKSNATVEFSQATTDIYNGAAQNTPVPQMHGNQPSNFVLTDSDRIRRSYAERGEVVGIAEYQTTRRSIGEAIVTQEETFITNCYEGTGVGFEVENGYQWESDESASSTETSSYTSECQDETEISMAIQAAELAAKQQARAHFTSAGDLIHRLFVCISGVADQLQTNFAADLRNILKTVFEVCASEDLEVFYVDSGRQQDAVGISNETSSQDRERRHSSRSRNSSGYEEPPPWVPDEECSYCTSCKAPFTVIRRKHHCRNCGMIFCGRCSANSVPLPRYGVMKPVRVCTRCYMFHVTPFRR